MSLLTSSETPPGSANPPLANLDLEQVVIGSLLLDPDALPDVWASLPPESFYSDDLRVAYTTIASTHENGSQVDFMTVADQLEKDRPTGHWLVYLAELARSVPSTANLMTYAQGVRKYHHLRQLYKAGDEICRAAYQGGNLDERIAEAQDAVQRVLTLDLAKGPQLMPASLKSWLAHLEDVADRKGQTGIPTGFAGLDDLIHGFRPGELIILAARPGQGKTVLALQFAGSAAMAGKSVLFFSLEMQSQELLTRMISNLSSTLFRNVQTADLDGLQWERVTNTVTKLNQTLMAIDDRGDQSIVDMRATARAHRNKHGVDLVVVDYLQLVNGQGESDVVRVGAVSKGLKAMAKELNCPVIALSQFSRAVEQRADGRPKLSDLRSSGQIEQDADIVMMLHRTDEHTTELICEKNRHGRTGSVWLSPRFENMRFGVAREPAPIAESAKPKRGLGF